MISLGVSGGATAPGRLRRGRIIPIQQVVNRT